MSRAEKALRPCNKWRQRNKWRESAVRSRNVNVVAVISDKYTTLKPLGKTFSCRGLIE